MNEQAKVLAELADQINSTLETGYQSPYVVAAAKKNVRLLLTLASQQQAEPPVAPIAQLSIPEDCPHMIVFDDTERERILFAGAGARSAALKMYEKVSWQWNAHLFVKIDSNARDVKYPNATPPVAEPLSDAEKVEHPVFAKAMELADSYADGPHDEGYYGRRRQELHKFLREHLSGRPYYVGGPYETQGGGYAVCETATGKVLLHFQGKQSGSST